MSLRKRFLICFALLCLSGQTFANSKALNKVIESKSKLVVVNESTELYAFTTKCEALTPAKIIIQKDRARPLEFDEQYAYEGHLIGVIDGPSLTCGDELYLLTYREFDGEYVTFYIPESKVTLID